MWSSEDVDNRSRSTGVHQQGFVAEAETAVAAATNHLPLAVGPLVLDNPTHPCITADAAAEDIWSGHQRSAETADVQDGLL